MLNWNKIFLFSHFKKRVVDNESFVPFVATCVQLLNEVFQLLALNRICVIRAGHEIKVTDAIHDVENIFWDAAGDYFTALWN